jgi:hypothetical protein
LKNKINEQPILNFNFSNGVGNNIFQYMFGHLVCNQTNYQFSHYEDIKVKEKCLYKINEGCGICQNKCIVNAYEGSTFNRKKCYEICLKNAKYYKSIGYADVCGKCLVGLPCSTKDPSINS